MSFPIPNAALDDRLAVVGTAGSGKTYLVLGAIEHLLARKSRVIGIDPLGVMWGLRLCADGATPSPFQPVIFGGAHGDLPITEHAGALIGETVATMRESCIIDLSSLGTKNAERRFMLAFLTALYRATDKEPVHLIVDEADMFAPQKLLDKEGDAAKLLGMMETVVRRGRVKGFIPWLITQRPAVLSKDVLSQADGLVGLKLTSSQDRKALGGWVESTADAGQWKAIDSALPAFQRGEGIVWIPARGILDTVSFPARATFDSSRTPKRGEKRESRELKQLNIDALKGKLATIETEAKANDPKALKARIAELEREAKRVAVSISSPSNEAAKTNMADLKAAREEGYATGYGRGHAEGYNEGRDAMFEAVWGAVGKFQDAVHVASDEARRAKTLTPTKKAPPVPGPAPVAQRFVSPKASALPKQVAQSKRTTPPANGHATLTNPQRQILAALAWWKAMGHDEVTRAQLAAKARFKVSGGHFLNRLSELARADYIAYPRSNFVTLTPAGTAVAPEPDLGVSVAASIRSTLTGPQAKLFDAMLENREMSREDLANAASFEAGGGHFLNRLSELSRMEIVTFPQRGQVLMQDWVTP